MKKSKISNVDGLFQAARRKEYAWRAVYGTSPTKLIIGQHEARVSGLKPSVEATFLGMQVVYTNVDSCVEVGV